MNNAQNLYKELIALCQLHLLQEYSLTERKESDHEVVEFFRKNTTKQTLAKPKEPIKELPREPVIESVPLEIAKPKMETTHTLPKEKAPILAKPTPAPKPQEPPKPVAWTLEPMNMTNSDSKASFQHLFDNEMPIVQILPDDAAAKKIQNSWKTPRVMPPVVVISFEESSRYQKFLYNISKAIQLHIVPAELISINNFDPQSTSLRLVIAAESGIEHHEHLKKLYRESQKGERTLGKVPLILLSELSLYFKQPHLKAALWMEIKNRISR